MEGVIRVSVVNTINWLKDTPKQIDICHKLSSYFDALNEKEIASYLSLFGMYKRHHQMDKWIDKIEEEKIVRFINNEERKLKKEWNGPSIPIFIFPSDQNNRKIKTEYKGRAGLAFRNKMFLFVAIETEKRDLRPLFIHEYHHVCRLAAIKKPEKQFTIIDTVIMEGLAENAVREKLGENDVATWTEFYSDDQCERFLDSIILPQKDVTRDSPKFTQLLFGTGLYPNMLGYAVGYFVVKNYMKQTGKTTKELIGAQAENFIKKLD